MMLFSEIEKKLTKLLTEFRSLRKLYYPEEGFRDVSFLKSKRSFNWE